MELSIIYHYIITHISVATNIFFDMNTNIFEYFRDFHSSKRNLMIKHAHLSLKFAMKEQTHEIKLINSENVKVLKV